MTAVLEKRLHQAQAEPMAPIDPLACPVSGELARRSDRLLERRRKQAGFRDPDKTLDNFDFSFSPKMRKLPHTAAEDKLEIIMRRYERCSTLLTSNRQSTTGANCSGRCCCQWGA
jgi:hypothetical protein